MKTHIRLALAFIICWQFVCCAHDVKTTRTDAKGVQTVTETTDTPNVPIITAGLSFLSGIAGALIPHSN